MMTARSLYLLLGAAALALAVPSPQGSSSNDFPLSEASAKAIFENNNHRNQPNIAPNLVKIGSTPVHSAPKPSATSKVTVSRIKRPEAATPVVNTPGVPAEGPIAVSVDRSVPLAQVTHEDFSGPPSNANFTLEARQACQYANCCPDPRYLNENTAYPWSVMGLWQLPGASCSATLVGPRHVLVASHCVDWDGVNKFGGVLYFSPQYWTGHSVGTYASHLVITYDDTPQVEPTTYNQYAFDYVIAILDTYPNLGWMGSKTYSTAWNGLTAWFESGYAGNKGGGVIPYAQNNFKVTSETGEIDGSDILQYTLCASPGDSGSAVFGWFSDGPYVIGTVSAGNPSQVFGPGGANVPNLIQSARTNNP